VPAITKKKKLIFGITATVILLLVIAGNIIAGRYKKIIQDVLPEAVSNSTDSLYRISVKGVSINFLTRSVTLKGVHMWPDDSEVQKREQDSTAKPMYFDVNIPKLKVSGIMWDKLTGGKGFSCGNFTITKPQVTISRTAPELTVYDTAKKKPIDKDFTVSLLKVTDANVRYIFSKHNYTDTVFFNRCNVELNNWQYAEGSLSDTGKFLMAENGFINTGVFTYSPSTSLYRHSCKNLRFNSEENKLTATDFRMKLRVTEAEFYRQNNTQKEIYDLVFPTIEFDHIDRNRLKTDKVFSSTTAYLNHSKITVSIDRRHPPNTISKLGKFPNQVLMNMKLPLEIARIKINNGSVAYTEVSDKTGKEATINFDNINGTVNNVVNTENAIQKDSTALATLKCKFNKYTDVTCAFRFSLTDPRGYFTLNASLAGMQSHQLNDQIKAFSMLELKSLNMKSMSLRMAGNENYAHGNFTMLYSNLGIRIMKNERNLSGDKKTKGFLTFVANNMILYSNNPMVGGDVRSIKTRVKRDELKSFFNLIWQNILQGVRETTIRNMNVIEWIRKNERNNNAIFNRERKKARKRDE